MKKTFFVPVLIVAVFTGLSSCQKDTSGEQDSVQQAIISNTFETVSNDIFKTLIYSVIAVNDSLYHPNDSNNFRLNDPCITCNLNSADTLSWPKTLHMTFPAGGCQCADGVSRAGELTIEIPGPAWPLNAKFNVTFNNYTVASAVVSGFKHINITDTENFSFTDSTNLVSVSVNPSGQWSATHYCQWVQGHTTPANITDDLFIYGGNASYESSIDVAEGISFQVAIVDALQFANFCYWIGSGKTEIISPGHSITTLTYPDSCLNQAVLCVDNKFQTITF
ncbi:MAG TPA: hypothetical protein PKN41_08660 [Bacteroidales bacterium]|nr:hypothetical protein [Bacteroidales bacterium]